MGRHSNTNTYKRILQISSKPAAEQSFHYLEGLETRVQIEVERLEPSILQEVMIIADRMKNLLSSGYSSFPD